MWRKLLFLFVLLLLPVRSYAQPCVTVDDCTAFYGSNPSCVGNDLTTWDCTADECTPFDVTDCTASDQVCIGSSCVDPCTPEVCHDICIPGGEFGVCGSWGVEGHSCDETGCQATGNFFCAPSQNCVEATGCVSPEVMGAAASLTCPATCAPGAVIGLTSAMVDDTGGQAYSVSIFASSGGPLTPNTFDISDLTFTPPPPHSQAVSFTCPASGTVTITQTAISTIGCLNYVFPSCVINVVSAARCNLGTNGISQQLSGPEVNGNCPNIR